MDIDHILFVNTQNVYVFFVRIVFYAFTWAALVWVFGGFVCLALLNAVLSSSHRGLFSVNNEAFHWIRLHVFPSFKGEQQHEKTVPIFDGFYFSLFFDMCEWSPYNKHESFPRCKTIFWTWIFFCTDKARRMREKCEKKSKKKKTATVQQRRRL